jgi:serine/threonine protein kinase
MADRIGQQLGHYRLVRLLGRGGFAEVYLGEHLRLKTQVAVKILHTSLEDDDTEDFLREAKTVAHLKHPHIVRVLDFDVENHTPYLVMDYLANGNVRRSYPKGTLLPLETIVSYVKQVASALQYAHDQKLIHRDVKPENMLLDQDNTIVLSDFGIALVAQSSRYQSTQEVAGTAAYMAPEQFQGHPQRASDQYALGVVVYEWLTGDRPFHGSFTEVVSQHMFVPPPSLRERVPTISLDIEKVVLTALEKDPHRRFGSVQAFMTALEHACQPLQPSATTSQTSSQPPPSLTSELYRHLSDESRKEASLPTDYGSGFYGMPQQSQYEPLNPHLVPLPIPPPRRQVKVGFIISATVLVLILISVGIFASFSLLAKRNLADNTIPPSSSITSPGLTPSPTLTNVQVTETLTAPFINGPNGATTTHSYMGNVIIKVSSYGRPGPTLAYSDAFYIFTDDSGNPITPVHPADFHFSLCINNQSVNTYVPQTPLYRSDHIYQFTISVGSGPQQLTFGICDTYTVDNSGSFFITVKGISAQL